MGRTRKNQMRPRADDSPRCSGRKAQALPTVIPQLVHLGPDPRGRQDQQPSRSLAVRGSRRSPSSGGSRRSPPSGSAEAVGGAAVVVLRVLGLGSKCEFCFINRLN